MKVWEITWDSPAGTARSTVRARDVEHAIKAWKKEHPKDSTRLITQVWRSSR